MRKDGKVELLKRHKYPPEDYDFAIKTIISQCEFMDRQLLIPIQRKINSDRVWKSK